MVMQQQFQITVDAYGRIQNVDIIAIVGGTGGGPMLIGIQNNPKLQDK